MEQAGRWEGGLGLETRVHPWWIHVDVWQTTTILSSNESPIKINKFIVKIKKKENTIGISA